MLLVDGCGHLAPGECWRSVLPGMVEFLSVEPPLVGVETTVKGKAE